MLDILLRDRSILIKRMHLTILLEKIITLFISPRYIDNSLRENLEIFEESLVEHHVRNEFALFRSSTSVREILTEIIYRMKRKLNISPGKIWANFVCSFCVWAPLYECLLSPTIKYHDFTAFLLFSSKNNFFITYLQMYYKNYFSF